MKIKMEFFYLEPDKDSFYADIVEIIAYEKFYGIILDKTYFYYGGGGQNPDTGTIGELRIFNVVEESVGVIHYTFDVPEIRGNVFCKIDWQNRKFGMQHHLAQHIISGLAYRKFGINTKSFHLGEKYATVDLEGHLDEQILAKIEFMGNSFISDGIVVNSFEITNKMLQNYDVRRINEKISEKIRLVEIVGLDTTFCCGLHPQNTIFVRGMKLIKYEYTQQFTRVFFVAGDNFVENICKSHSILKELCLEFSCNEMNLKNTVDKLKNKLDIGSKVVKNLEKDLELFFREKIFRGSEKIGEIELFHSAFLGHQKSIAAKITDELIKKENKIVLILFQEESKVSFLLAFAENMDISIFQQFNKSVSEIYHLKGGGKKNRFNFILEEKEKAESVLKVLHEKMKEMLVGRL